MLFCDYDGEFEYADLLSRLGYLVDQIRPDSLRSVAVGEHSVYLFSFGKKENTQETLKVCRKLKSAELETPIVILARSEVSSDFSEHPNSRYCADSYISNFESEAEILDAIDEILPCPLPKSLSQSNPEEVHPLMEDMQKEIEELSLAKEKAEQTLEAQRNFYKPKLKALLEEQKTQPSELNELEQLKVKLSEIEAKLLEREARVKELEKKINAQKEKMAALTNEHEKAQASLRTFYQEKIRNLTAEKSD